MSNRFTKSVTVLALSVCAALAASAAAADELPGRVGRIALAQGQVTISADSDAGGDGSETNNALVNWPVTSRNQIVTARGARTEVRVGSTAIRLDGDSALDVVELDDDSVRLHLHYGSVSVRLHNRDVVRGFELSTPQGRVRLQEPGRIRVDAGREQDTTVLNVFEGVALLDGSGSSLTVRAGRRAELQDDDIRTAQAVPTSFDDWTVLRDRRESHAAAERYVTSEMTGYEELDQHGVWRDDNEYGPLWTPRNVAAGWAPYRDGRWTYLAPWGWTWVDNAAWGYAPSHYGRWVMVNQRWCWAPGRNIGRPIWAPALVGWVGGSGWNVSFGSHRGRYAPAQGWYPLSPRDSFLPGYRVPQDHLRYINRHARQDGDKRRGHGHAGLTVVQQDHFGRRGPIVVSNVPKGVVAPQALPGVPGSAPPRPHGQPPQRNWRVDTNGDGRVDRGDRAGNLIRPGVAGAQAGLDRNGDGRVDQIVRDRNGDGRVDRGDLGGRVLRTDTLRTDTLRTDTMRTDTNGDGRVDMTDRTLRTDANGDGRADRNDRPDRTVGLDRGAEARPNPRNESEAAARRAAWMQREQDDLRNDRNERDQRRFGAPRYSAGTLSGPAGAPMAPRPAVPPVPPVPPVQSAPPQPASAPVPPAALAAQPQGDRFGRMRELEQERRQRQSDVFNRPSPMPVQAPMAMPALPPPRPLMAPSPMPQQQVQMARPAPMQAAPAPMPQAAQAAPQPRGDNGGRERPQRLTNGRDRENLR